MDNHIAQKIQASIRAAATRPLACILPLLAAGACARAAAPAAPAPEAAAVPAAAEELVLVGSTDVHGNVLPHDYYTGRATDYGLALLKPVVDSIRAANPGRVYLFDSGDLIQGNALGMVYARIEKGAPNPIIRAMNLLGYDAGAVGNHEFNYGLEHLERAVAQASYPFVSANIFRHGTGEHAFRPYVLLPHATAAGDTVLVGVTGNTPPGVHLWDRQHVEGVLEFRDVVASLTPVVKEMRARGADVVVVLSHGGLEGTSYDTAATGLPAENESARVAREVPGVDVVFMGHTHREVADTTITGPANPEGVLLTQPKNWAASLAVATLRLERRGVDVWEVVGKKGKIVRPDPARVDAAFADSLRDAHERTLTYVGSVIGRSTARMESRTARVEDTPILDFINEVQRKVSGAQLSAAAAFTLGSVIPEGDVTVADIAGLYVYDNTLKAVRVTGAELEAYLEQSARYYTGWPPAAGASVTSAEIPGYNFDVVSGVDYTIDLSRPAGDRITALTYEGRPVRPEDTFTLAVNNYRQGGGGGFSMIAGAPVVYDRQENIRDLLIEEVERRGVIRPGDYFRRNWRIVPAAAADSALGEQTRREARPTAAATTARKRLRVLATNDFHGRLLPERERGHTVGGAATLAAYFAREHARFGGPTVILDGGDVMQGTPISNLTEGRSTVDYYNLAGYTAAALGNHEFDWGVDVLKERVRQARFPWLAANIEVAGTDTAPSWVRQAAMLDVDGVKLGVIGLATEETPEVTMPSRIRGLEFTSEAAAIDRWVPELRRQGADFVVVVAHSGAVCEAPEGPCTGEIVDVAGAVTHRPDLIVAGHTHRLVRTVVNGIAIVEAGRYGTTYGVVDLERVSADSVDVRIRGLPVAFTDSIAPDPEVEALVERYRREIGPRVDRVVATLAETLQRDGREFALGRLIADAQRTAADAQVAFMNNGGIRASLEAGTVTWGQVFSVQPFENRVVRLRVTGEQLRQIAESYLTDDGPDAHLSGLVVRYDPARPRGERIVEMRLDGGAEIRPDESYVVALNNFMADQLEEDRQPVVSREDLDLVDLDALVRYLEAFPGPVRAPAEPRWVAATAAAATP